MHTHTHTLTHSLTHSHTHTHTHTHTHARACVKIPEVAPPSVFNTDIGLNCICLFWEPVQQRQPWVPMRVRCGPSRPLVDMDPCETPSQYMNLKNTTLQQKHLMPFLIITVVGFTIYLCHCKRCTSYISDKERTVYWEHCDENNQCQWMWDVEDCVINNKFLLGRAVTIVRNTSAINYSRSLMIQGRVCVSAYTFLIFI